MQRWLAALRGLDRLVLHRPCSPMPDQPPQSSPGAALLQGPLGVWCHGSILRTVAEHLGPSQRLPEGLPHAMLHPRRSGWERHQPGTYSKTVSLGPADHSCNVTLSRYIRRLEISLIIFGLQSLGLVPRSPSTCAWE